jgi:hypothetical protein
MEPRYFNRCLLGRFIRPEQRGDRLPTPRRYLLPVTIGAQKQLVDFQLLYSNIRSRDSVVGIATGRSTGRSSSPDRVKGILFSKSSRPALRSTQPPIQWVPRALSLGVKRPGRKVDHSPPTSAEVKKMWIYTSTPIRLHGVVLN